MWIRRATLQRPTYKQLSDGSSASIWRNSELVRTGWPAMAVETGRFGAARVERQLRLCQRCEGSTVDDVEHMIFDSCSLEAERQKRQSLFARGRVDLADFFEQDPIELAAFVHGCFKACNEVQEV